MRRLWHLGNTTVRSPFRLREGLVALSTSPLQGNLRGGAAQDIAFRQLLGAHGVVTLGEDATNSVGRKWRSALGKMGFLYPEVPRNSELPQSEIGPVDMITPNGWRLIRAETVPAMQECFLRALAAYYIPSPSERDYGFSAFSPLRHVLSIMLELEKKTGDSRLNFIEMAVIVQVTSSDENMPEIIDKILNLRIRRDAAPNKRRFDAQERSFAAETFNYMPQSFNDYADANIRYLKSTGLVLSKGKGVCLNTEKHVFIEKLVLDSGVPATDKSYLITLCNGATLPTDSKDSALAVLDDLLAQLNRRGIPFDIANKPTKTAADIAIVRHEIEALLSEQNEENYAALQASQWEEIATTMELIATRKRSATLPNGDEVEVPLSELPAYFEWILWRAFLAIDSLKNKPYEARRFKIDQDFLPIGTAPGGGPDLIFEFEDFVIVVEVTLTDGSRQEAAEGEPVRRHVADIAMDYAARLGKPVYGLFLANRIDSNTAETFRSGVWYTRTDEKLKLDIVPLTLTQFKDFFKGMFSEGKVDVAVVRNLLDQCGEHRHLEAPIWKTEIERTMHHALTQLLNPN